MGHPQTTSHQKQMIVVRSRLPQSAADSMGVVLPLLSPGASFNNQVYVESSKPSKRASQNQALARAAAGTFFESLCAL